MSYTPNATEETQPTGDKPAGSAAPEFRALKAHVKAQFAAINASLGVLGGADSSTASALLAMQASIDAIVSDGQMEVLHTTTITTPGAFVWNKPVDMPADATVLVRMWGAGAAGEAMTNRVAGTGGTVAIIKQLGGILGGMGGGFQEFAFPISALAAAINGSVGAGGVSPTEVYNGYGGDFYLGANGGDTVWDTNWIAFGGKKRQTVYGGTIAPKVLSQADRRSGSILGIALAEPLGLPGVPRPAVSTVGCSMLADGFVDPVTVPFGEGIQHAVMGGPAGGSILYVGLSGGTQLIDAAGAALTGATGGAAVVDGNGANGTGAGAGGGASVQISAGSATRKGGTGGNGRAEIYIVRGKQRAINNNTTIVLP